jgi:hypothetical protein
MPYLDIFIQYREHRVRNSIHPSVLRMSDPFDFYQNNFFEEWACGGRVSQFVILRQEAHQKNPV